MTLPLPRPVLIACAALAAAAVPALAADPGAGEVSSASPKVEWKGAAGGYGVSIVSDVNGSFPACGPSTCDEFTLTVKDQADLTVAVTTDDGTGFTTIEVEDPDGAIAYNGGAADNPTTVIKLKKAKPGEYLVRSMTNNPPAQGDAYTGTATLATAAPAAPAPAPAQPGAPAPGQPAAPAPAQQQATISIKPGRYSARKLRKKALVAGLSSTGRVTNLVATLKKGSKTVAKGRLAELNGSGRVSLKGKRLKAGTYTLRVAGRSEGGNAVGAQAKLKIGR